MGCTRIDVIDELREIGQLGTGLKVSPPVD